MTETTTEPEPPATQIERKSGIMVTALVVSIVAVAVGTAGVTFGIIERSDVSSQAKQITVLRHQQAVLGRELAAIKPKLAGAARDVITCGDLQGLGLSYYWLDSNFNLQSNPIQLPQHCINH